MIRILMTRKQDRLEFDLGAREVTPTAALSTLMWSELGFGGNITEATGTRLTVVTRVLACIDTTVFEGTEEEMRILNEAAYYYLEACQKGDTVIDGVLADLARLPNGKGGVPLIINMAAPMLIGRNRLALATMMALGITAESDIEAGMSLGINDLVTVYQLMQEFPGTSFAEMVAATTVSKAA